MQKNAEHMYIITALSMLLFWIPHTTAMMASTCLFIGSIFMCSYYYKKSNDTIFQNHFLWVKRTLWIGAGLFIPVVTAFMVFIVLKFGDMSVFDDIAAGDMAALMNEEVMKEKTKQFIIMNLKLLLPAMISLCLPVILWWYRRLWIGYSLLKSDREIENPKSWK